MLDMNFTRPFDRLNILLKTKQTNKLINEQTTQLHNSSCKHEKHIILCYINHDHDKFGLVSESILVLPYVELN